MTTHTIPCVDGTTSAYWANATSGSMQMISP